MTWKWLQRQACAFACCVVGSRDHTNYACHMMSRHNENGQQTSRMLNSALQLAVNTRDGSASGGVGWITSFADDRKRVILQTHSATSSACLIRGNSSQPISLRSHSRVNCSRGLLQVYVNVVILVTTIAIDVATITSHSWMNNLFHTQNQLEPMLTMSGKNDRNINVNWWGSTPNLMLKIYTADTNARSKASQEHLPRIVEE